MNNTEKYSLTWFLYVLECTDNRYYVGITYNVKKRLWNHFNGRKGAVFTTIYPPIKCIELFKLPTEVWDEAELYENYKTIEYAIKYGGENVAGGGFCLRDDLSRKRGIDNAIKNNEVSIAGKKYKLNDETLLKNLVESKILELYELSLEEISESIIKKQQLNKSNNLNSNIIEFLRFDEIEPLIADIICLKHKTLVAMSLIYKNKPSRMVRIKLEHINRKEMTLDVPRRKNTISSPMEQGLLNLIETYYKAEINKPTDFLFKGVEEGHHWGCGYTKKILSEIKKHKNL